MKTLKLLGLISALQIVTACGLEIDPRTLWHNREGAKQMQASAPSEAQKSYLQALGVDPFISEIHTNLGLTYHTLKQGEQALQSYESAEKWAKNDNAAFAARFNQGVLRGENKKIEEALLAYQRALAIRPDSIETKTNIELLVQNQMKNDGGKGQEENQDKNQQGNQGSGDQQQKNQGESKDQQDQENNQNKKPDPKGSPQYKPREFQGDLPESEVKKILSELKQQEQKIRGQFYRNETKERPRDKDW